MFLTKRRRQPLRSHHFETRHNTGKIFDGASDVAVAVNGAANHMRNSFVKGFYDFRVEFGGEIREKFGARFVVVQTRRQKNDPIDGAQIARSDIE